MLGKLRKKMSPSDKKSSRTSSSRSKVRSEGKDRKKRQTSERGLYLRKLKDYSLLMEFKRLKGLAPTGIYVMPATDTLRRWYGVIFLRKSHYRKGIFKFFIQIPEQYPDLSPRIYFTSKIFNPLIHPDTGELDLSIQFSKWDPSRHYIVLLLAYIKKIFYKVEYWSPRRGRTPYNLDASNMWLHNKAEFMKLAATCAALSVEKVYENDENSSVRFTQPVPAHEECLRRIISEKNAASSDRGKKLSYLSWFVDGVDQLPSRIHV